MTFTYCLTSDEIYHLVNHFPGPAGLTISSTSQDATAYIPIVPGYTAVSYSVVCQPIPPGMYIYLQSRYIYIALYIYTLPVYLYIPTVKFPVILPQACTTTYSCYDPIAAPSILTCWIPCDWTQPIDLTYPDPSAKFSYPQADQHCHPTWCHLKTYWGCIQSPHQDCWLKKS